MPAHIFNPVRAALAAVACAWVALGATPAIAHETYSPQAPVAIYHQPGYQVAPQVVVVEPAPMDPRGMRRSRHAHNGCGARAWEPWTRYMPGQVVWRDGGLWVARGVSASVWNENSPPEWTPRYWARAFCR